MFAARANLEPKSKRRQLFVFVANTAFGSVISLLSIPAVIHLVGTDEWSALAVGQTVGGLLGLVAGWGWATIGPATVAGGSPALRRKIFTDSVPARIYLTVLMGAPAFFIIPLVLNRRQDGTPATIAAIALLVGALSSSWFLVGIARPDMIFRLDTLPRSAGTIVGVGALSLGAPLEAFAMAQVAGSLSAALLAFRWITVSSAIMTPGTELRLDWNWRSVVRQLKAASSGMVTNLAASIYVYSPVMVVARLAPDNLASYALADRVLKFATVSLVPLTQFAQASVPTSAPAEMRRTVNRIIVATSITSIALAAGTSALLPVATTLMSAGQNSAGWVLSVGMGVTLGCVLLSSVVGLSCLIVVGGARWLAWSTVVGAVVGVPSYFVLGATHGMNGVVVAVASVEIMVAVFRVGSTFILARRVGDSIPA